MNQNIKDTQNLLDFISKSPSPFHVVANMKKELIANGFIQLKENEKFNIEKGKKYFVERNSSSLIAFSIPQSFKGFSIVSAHTDSPTFKIKPNPEILANGYIKLNIEKYGGMLLSPWFDRPLSVAGRVFVLKDGEVKEQLFDIPKPLLSIVNLAIHQNRTANDGIKYSVQKELLPLFAQSSDKKAFSSFIAKQANCTEDELLDYDLFLYNRCEPVIWGLDDEFFSSPKIDDLQCSYSAFKSLIEAEPKEKIAMVSLFDNEEVGSGTRQGALSDFLSTTINRVMCSLNIIEEERYSQIASSFMVSADNGHAVHPNYADKSDVTNLPVINGGILLKYSANQKYTTDASTGAFLKALMKKNDIPYQVFVNNSDQLGGSTLGNLSIQKISIPTCDVGVAQLAMHSPYECGGTKDTTALLKLFTTFLSL